MKRIYLQETQTPIKIPDVSSVRSLRTICLRMKRYNLILFVVMLCSGNLFAQENFLYEKTFVGYVGFVSKEYGITCKIPEKFTDLDQYFVIQRIREDREAGSMYGPIFQAKDKECIVEYPFSPWPWISPDELGLGISRKDSYPRAQIIFELNAALGFPDYLQHRPSNDTIPRINALRDTSHFVFDDYVTIIAGKKAREMFNADSIFCYNIPLQKPYQKKYTYCTGMVLSKKDRASMYFKYFFTPKGKKKEDKYINLLSKQIWYNEKF